MSLVVTLELYPPPFSCCDVICFAYLNLQLILCKESYIQLKVSLLATDINTLKPLRPCALLFQDVEIQRKGRNMPNTNLNKRCM